MVEIGKESEITYYNHSQARATCILEKEPKCLKLMSILRQVCD